jgi:hypothetical protein
MAFRKSSAPAPVPDSPEKLFLDLPRRKIPDVLPHQREIMRSFAAQALNWPDVAMQLPTGSGKTLVGLLVGEWLRRKNQERVVYLCPTRQLVNQVQEQSDRYGISVVAMSGPITKYSPDAKADYKSADRIAVTTYSSLFNTNPYFDDADVVILDDAHSAENYVADMWSLRIERLKHENLHAALRGLLRRVIDSTALSRISGIWDGSSSNTWVDKLPTPKYLGILEEFREIVDEHVEGFTLKHQWKMIRDNLSACHLYLSAFDILVRPLMPPTWTHAPFAEPRQRIYMSATLGLGGDLERLTGKKAISRLPIPDGWDQQGVGRRFFVFPEMSLRKEDIPDFRRLLMQEAGRSLVLVPNDDMQEEITKDVKDNLHFKVFDAEAIEKSKKPFTQLKNAVAVIAGRYDGIDFPGDECRLLFIEGLPKALNLQERFLMSRMGANLLFNERVQIRVLQAIGRCTRSLEDYSAVIVSGNELPDYLGDLRRRKYLHPDLQGEIAFGLEQSKGADESALLENFKIFLANGEEWEEANDEIVKKRKLAKQERFPSMDELRSIVGHEIDYQAALWQGDYEEALGNCEKVLAKLSSAELKGYRALWHYLAGSSAWLAGSEQSSFRAKARQQFKRAKEAAKGIPWLVLLAQFEQAESESPSELSSALEQIERVELVLERLGTLHERAFAKEEKEILEGLKDPDSFENAHRQLGELIGFQVGKIESNGSPDPWWMVADLCFVFEDHAGAKPTGILDVTKARQVSSHPNWMRRNVPAAQGKKIVAVLLTPVSQVRESATAHLTDVAMWRLNDFQAWAQTAVSIVRELRASFLEPGNLIWRANAAEKFKQNGMDGYQLLEALTKNSALIMLKPVK